MTEAVVTENDEALIGKILAGEKLLFGTLVRRHNTVLYRIARAYGFNHHDAEDLMQDAHVMAYTNLKNFEGRASYKTWISKIMVNHCLYKLKYGYFKNEIPTESFTDSNSTVLHMSINENQADKMLVSRELTSVLERSIQRIPDIYRTIFIMREVEGFSVQETAELLDISPVNVKVRLNRAKTLLQKEVEQLYPYK
ncbi:MAG: sigma-70 family RNA polymerase sigma factor, partial [Chitinophagaceae bacterium]